jgi:hypothetical protein
MVCFQTKNPNLGKFWPFGIFCSHLVYFSPFLVYCTKKNLSTLTRRGQVFSSASYHWQWLLGRCCTYVRFFGVITLQSIILEH